MPRPEIEESVKEIILDQMGEGPQDFTQCFDVMGVDSLDKIEILMEIESDYDIEIEDEIADTWTCLRDVVEYLSEVLL